MGDIIYQRTLLSLELEKARKSSDIQLADPVVTKPAPFLSIRDIVARYSRGEIVSVPEKVIEQPVYDDTVEHLKSYSNDLEMQQRVKEFENEYETAKKARDAADERGSLSQHSETVPAGSETGNDA